MLTLNEVKEIINVDGVNYNDEELIQMRDWLERLADIAIEAIEGESSKEKSKHNSTNPLNQKQP